MGKDRPMRLKAGIVAAVLMAAVTFALAGSGSAQGSETQASDGCHVSYVPCVPIATDVDCASGEGDGPVFIDYPVQVIGDDVYDLDRGDTGIGCENETGTGPPRPQPEPEPEPEPQPAPTPEPSATPAQPVQAEPDFTG
jgi:hypothetical protein